VGSCGIVELLLFADVVFCVDAFHLRLALICRSKRASRVCLHKTNKNALARSRKKHTQVALPHAKQNTNFLSLLHFVPG
jgi:hypothetical protein